jgi:hypothetical protein
LYGLVSCAEVLSVAYHPRKDPRTTTLLTCFVPFGTLYFFKGIRSSQAEAAHVQLSVLVAGNLDPRVSINSVSVLIWYCNALGRADMGAGNLESAGLQRGCGAPSWMRVDHRDVCMIC